MSCLLSAGAGAVALSVVLAIAILLIMICVHELGHYLAGRALNFAINEFSVGFGPAIFKRRGKKRGTLFSIRALPLGGYCSFEGEDGEGESERAFNSKRPWQRIAVLVSGALLNYLTAVVLIIIMLFCYGLPSYKVGSVTEQYPAEYSLASDDVIVAVEGRDIYLPTDLTAALKGKSKGETAKITVLREGEKVEREIILAADCSFSNSADLGGVWRALGAGTYAGADGNLYWNVTAQNVRYGFFQTLAKSFVYSFKTVGAIFNVLGELLSGRMGLQNLGGPITTVKVTGEVASGSFEGALQIAAYIGVNLAVFNLLPLPALDGGKIVFCLIEWIFRRPVPRRVEAAIHLLGLVALFAFAITVDILQFI